jgi:hypothetical protein
MIQPGHTPTSLQLHERDDAGKEMIRLRPHPLGGRSGKGCVALETLVVLFDLPPFLVKRPKRRSRQRQVTRAKVHNAFGAVFVREDLAIHQKSERNVLQVKEHNGVGTEIERTEFDGLARFCPGIGQKDVAVALERDDEVLLGFLFLAFSLMKSMLSADENHVSARM